MGFSKEQMKTNFYLLTNYTARLNFYLYKTGNGNIKEGFSKEPMKTNFSNN